MNSIGKNLSGMNWWIGTAMTAHQAWRTLSGEAARLEWVGWEIAQKHLIEDFGLRIWVDESTGEFRCEFIQETGEKNAGEDKPVRTFDFKAQSWRNADYPGVRAVSITCDPHSENTWYVLDETGVYFKARNLFGPGLIKWEMIDSLWLVANPPIG